VSTSTQPVLRGVKACVFDAYGTLFDVSSVAHGAQDALGERWHALSDLWRTKQLQYSWLRSLTDQHADFWQITGDALDFALATLHIQDKALRERLLHMYLAIKPFAEVAETLTQLKQAGEKLAILSNGTPVMLQAAVKNAGLEGIFDAVLSVEDVGVFKPHPLVYQLATDRLGIRREEICFLSSNGWDAYSAKAYGFQVVWCNRFNQPPEHLPSPPDAQIRTLDDLPALIARSA
jgi:2-haloacid dehalogenase